MCSSNGCTSTSLDTAAAEGMTQQKLRKIVMLGPRFVGKTILTERYIDDNFEEKYYPTVLRISHTSVRHKEEDFALEILDRAIQDEYAVLESNIFVGVRGYIIVYSVGSERSFKFCPVIANKIFDRLGTRDIPIMIVASKSDLDLDQRRVTISQGKSLAGELGGGFVEVSSRNNENVGAAFEGIVGEIERRDQAQRSKTRDAKCVFM